MEVIVSTEDHEKYPDDLSEGELHLVTYAEDGASIFAASLQFLTIGPDDITKVCDQINQSEETGTLWPVANVTAIPKKFCREDLDDRQALHYCIRDAFVANRDYGKSRKMLFNFTGGVLNGDALEDEIQQFAMGEFNAAPLEEVEVWFDPDPGAFVY